MNNVGKLKYGLYLMKQNKKLIILLNIILAVLICGIEGTLILTLGIDELSAMTYTIVVSAILAMIISVIVPLFMMKMLYHKKSCDFYCALPIKRKDVYVTHVIFGLVATMLPIILYYTIGLLFAHQAPLGYEVKYSFDTLGKALAVILLNMFAMQAMTTFISVRCNNLIDALLLIGCYIVVPLVLMISLYAFFDRSVQEITLGYGNYLGFDFIIEHMIIFLSVPVMIFQQLTKMLTNQTWDWHMIYWFVVSIVSMLLSARYYIHRKPEDSESITNFHMGYPLMIVLSVLCMMLLGFGLGLNIWITIIFTMLIYFIVLFIWKRKIYLTVKNIGVYVCLLAVCASLQYAFVNTNGFHRISEVPTKNYQEVEVVVCLTYDVISTDEVVMEEYRLTSNEQQGMAALKQFHKDVLSYVEPKEDYSYITFEVNYGKHQETFRRYYLTKNILLDEIMPRMEKLKESKQIKYSKVDY